MTVKYKQLKFAALALVIMASVAVVLVPRTTHAAPVCTSGQTLVPASGAVAEHCEIATGISPAVQSACDNKNKPRFIGLVPWYEYLDITTDNNGGCKITNFDDQSKILGTNGVGRSTSPFLLIGLAILDDLVRVAAIVAVGFVIYGGIQYVTSQGAPDSTKQAQQTIINALIGLVVALIAAGLVSFIGNRLGN